MPRRPERRPHPPARAARRGDPRGRGGDPAAQADVVVGFGGYVSTPAYLAARRRGVPIVVHEANARPGLANRLGARLTRHVGATFPGTGLPAAQVVGMPLRRRSPARPAALRAEARARFGLGPMPHPAGHRRLAGRPAAQRHVRRRPSAGCRRRHPGAARDRPGQGRSCRRAACAAALPYVVVEYLDRMDLAYAAADLVVCRSGASTVCELTAVGLPAATCRCRSATASSGSTPSPWSRPAAACSSTTPTLHARSGCATSFVPLARPRGWRAHGRRPPPRSAIRTPTSGWPTWCVAAAASVARDR